MSPRIVTFSPAIFPFFSRMVNASSNACVGCSCAPSPALMTLALSNARQKMRRADRAVADDDEVRVQRLEIARGVLERLAFFERRRLGGKIDDVGGQPLRGQFKADARARGRLDEQVDDRLAAQRRNFLDGALADGLERARRVEHGDDFLRA